MKKRNIIIYSNTFNEEIEKEFDVYTRDELIEYIQNNNIDLNEFALEVYAPHCLKCSIETLKTMDKNNEFFIFEEDNEIHMYL